MLSLTEQPHEMSLTLSVESPYNTSNNPPSRNQLAGRKILAPIESKEDRILPLLSRSNDESDNQTSQPTDYLPEELLFVLAPPSSFSSSSLGPPNRSRNLHVSSVIPRKPPSNAWNYSKQREKLKHLLKNTPCICGAGDDLTFLCEIQKPSSLPSLTKNASDLSSLKTEDLIVECKKSSQLPNALLPEEYRIVRNKGVTGLSCRHDEYTVVPEDHEKHLVQLPSLNPANRVDVVQLKQALEDMLEKAGLNDDLEFDAASQMHQLMDLIKKEQNIYNLIFHELIRQVSIECFERGELLAEVRNRYSDLLNRVPKQIKSLHEEVLAQRALDRRLTEELNRFKSTVMALNSELSAIRDHDSRVTRHAAQTQEELKAALIEAQKNSDLLSEYHELYELQRKRLEKQVQSLTSELQLWCDTCYTLSNKVMEEHSLNNAKKLCVIENSWLQLAGHFTVALSEKDTCDLTIVQSLTDQWRERLDEFYGQTKVMEEDVAKQLSIVVMDLRKWKIVLEEAIEKRKKSTVGQDGTFLSKEKLNQLIADLRCWQQVLNHVSDQFGGETVLAGQDVLKDLRTKMSEWTNCMITVFNRHNALHDGLHPCHEFMIQTNQEVDCSLKQFQRRVTGENDVAGGVIHVGNSLEAWETRLVASLTDHNSMTEQQWTQFVDVLEDSALVLSQSSENVGSTKGDESTDLKNSLEVTEVMKLVHKWVMTTTRSIDSEDAKLIEQVNILHKDLVHWITQSLLSLAPDHKGLSEEAKEQRILHSMTTFQLQDRASTLAKQLSDFSSYLSKCCTVFVSEDVQRRMDRMEDNASHEQDELARLKVECEDWIKTSCLVLQELSELGGPNVLSSTGLDGPDILPLTGLDGVDSRPSTGLNRPDARPSTENPEVVDMPLIQDPQEGSPSLINGQDPQEVSILLINTAESKVVNEDILPSSTQLVPSKPSTPKNQSRRSDSNIDDQSEQPKSTDLMPVLAVDDIRMASEEQQRAIEFEVTEVTEHGEKVENEHPEHPEPGFEMIHVIGHDSNTRAVPFETGESTPRTQIAGDEKNGSYEAISSIQFLQQQLVSAESRAQKAEDRAMNAELELEKALERIRALERLNGTTSSAATSPSPRETTLAVPDSKETAAKGRKNLTKSKIKKK